VILDSHDKPWILTVAAITTVGGVSYLAYAAAKPAGPSGGTWPGLIYGIIGTLLMSFSGLLGARKKVPTLRIGRVHWWMRGHVWLGLLSFPMILFHAGFSMGGPLTYVLMILFMMILLSGIIGLILQQFVPRLMMDQVPVEVIYERAGDMSTQLLERAEQCVESLKPKASAVDPTRQYDIVSEFYMREVKPYLSRPKGRTLLSTPQRAKVVFDHIEKLVPATAHQVIDELRTIVQQRRDLARQVKLHHILHLWLLVHVIVALRYS
jgi:hypothetical protein